MLFVVITAAVPVLTAYTVVLVRKVGDNAAANAENTKAKTYITEAAEKALAACLASISQAAQRFIEAAYGDIREYLTTRIGAEVRKQKNEAPLLLSSPVMGELVSN